MIKRTPQEIADIFQCYVAMNQDGAWYMFEEKPERQERTWRINSKHFAYLHSKLIDIPFPCDWTHLYEPRPYSEKSADSINKEASYSEEAPVSENKPAHLGEVYTHKEYRIEHSLEIEPLNNRITYLMNRGWKPQGGINVNYSPSLKTASYHQAMVRGV